MMKHLQNVVIVPSCRLIFYSLCDSVLMWLVIQKNDLIRNEGDFVLSFQYRRLSKLHISVPVSNVGHIHTTVFPFEYTQILLHILYPVLHANSLCFMLIMPGFFSAVLCSFLDLSVNSYISGLQRPTMPSHGVGN